ncbi:MAG: hypothetical protein JO104_11975 [Candidatus Eremiobacteraeota bacterium]|nr:hypothetical protein [Candidatus Eremiobacteraeota bacterium]
MVLGAALLSCCSHQGIVPVSIRDTSPRQFNVRDYGARGNGRADDTQAIQTTLAAATANGGGTVFFPEGVYAIAPAEGPFYVASKVTFAGVGRESVIHVADDAGQYNFIFGQHPGRLHDVAFRDLRIDQNPAGNRTANINPQTDAENVIQLYSFDGLDIENVSFDPEPGIQAIVAAGPNRPSGLNVTRCFFRFVRGSSSNPNYDESTVYAEAGQVRIRDNLFETASRQNAITAIELHGGPHADVESNIIREFEIGMNLEESTNGYPNVPAAHFTIARNNFERTALGVDLWSNAPRVLRAVSIHDNTFSFSQHRLYHDFWVGIELQPGGRSKGLGGDFDGIVVDRNLFDFSLLLHQRIATEFSAAFDLAPDGLVRHFSARGNRMIDPPAIGINVGKVQKANRSEDVTFDDDRIDGAGWDTKAPAGERAAVVFARATMRNVHADNDAIVAPSDATAAYSFIVTPRRGSTNVTLRYDRVIPRHVLAHRVGKRVDTAGTVF